MSHDPGDLELEAAREILLSGDEDSEEFEHALRTLREWVEAGNLEDAGLLAEIVALEGPHHDAATAYVMYYVAHALDGYLVPFQNSSELPGHYLGPVGDFRNESMVSDLVRELGLSALPDLDAKGAALLAHGI